MYKILNICTLLFYIEDIASRKYILNDVKLNQDQIFNYFSNLISTLELLLFALYSRPPQDNLQNYLY